MVIARVRGRTHATVKDETLNGRTLLLCQPLDINHEPAGDPLIVIDVLGARQGDLVTLSSDGKSKSERLNSPLCPGRWLTMGIIDE